MSRTFRPKIALLVFSFVPLYSDIVFTHESRCHVHQSRCVRLHDGIRCDDVMTCDDILIARVWITLFYVQTTAYLPLPRKRSPDGATNDCSLPLICRSRKDERLSWPSWLTYSERFTHTSGHRELDVGPIFLTRPNLTHKWSDPTRPDPYSFATDPPTDPRQAGHWPTRGGSKS